MSSEICSQPLSTTPRVDSGRILTRSSFNDAVLLVAPTITSRRTNSEDYSIAASMNPSIMNFGSSELTINQLSGGNLSNSPHGKVLWKKVQQFTHRLHRRMAELTPHSGPQAPDWVHFLQYQQQSQKTHLIETSGNISSSGARVNNQLVDRSIMNSNVRRSHGNLNYLVAVQQTQKSRRKSDQSQPSVSSENSRFNLVELSTKESPRHRLRSAGQLDSWIKEDTSVRRIVREEPIVNRRMSVRAPDSLSLSQDRRSSRRLSTGMGDICSTGHSPPSELPESCIGYITFHVPSVTNKILSNRQSGTPSFHVSLRQSRENLSKINAQNTPHRIAHSLDSSNMAPRHSLATVTNIWQTLPYANLPRTKCNRSCSSFSSPSPEKKRNLFSKWFTRQPFGINGTVHKPMRYLTSIVSKKDTASAPSLGTSDQCAPGVVCSEKDLKRLKKIIHNAETTNQQNTRLSVGSGDIKSPKKLTTTDIKLSSKRKPTNKNSLTSEVATKSEIATISNVHGSKTEISKDKKSPNNILAKFKFDKRNFFARRRSQSSEALLGSHLLLPFRTTGSYSSASKSPNSEYEPAKCMPEAEILGRALQIHLENVSKRSHHESLSVLPGSNQGTSRKSPVGSFSTEEGTQIFDVHNLSS